MNNTKIYTPGEIICNLNDKVSGRGTYVIDNQIIASIIGCLAIDQSTIQLVSVFDDDLQPELKVGSLVLAKVIKIKEDKAFVKVLKVDGKKFNANLEGVIRRQNIRKYEIDKIQMDQCFHPGDILITRMISYGDSHTIYLSTSEDSLGVLFAKNQESRQLMLPISWEEMICVKTGLREKRVVAKPDFSKFQTQPSQ